MTLSSSHRPSASCDREAGAAERRDHPIFAVDGMGAGQQLAGRLAAQHVGAGGRDELVGRVGLAALELLDGERPGEAVDVGRQPLLEFGAVEAMRVADLRSCRYSARFCPSRSDFPSRCRAILGYQSG